jgi:hypothetical protein
MSKKKFSPGGTSLNGGLQGIMKKAQQLQSDIERTQRELEDFKCEAQSGGGQVKVVLDGRYRLISLTINPEVVNRDEVDLLQDMIQAAFNEAVTKVQLNAQEEMGKVTGGMSIPGLF